MYIDIIFAMGVIGFICASIRQLRKLYRTKRTEGLSLTKYYIKLYAICCMLTGYILSSLPISITVSLVELTIVLTSIHLIVKYRWGRFEWRKLLNFI